MRAALVLLFAVSTFCAIGAENQTSVNGNEGNYTVDESQTTDLIVEVDSASTDNGSSSSRIFLYQKPYETAPFAFHNYLIVVLATVLCGIAITHVIPFVVLMVLTYRPLSRKPTQEDIEFVEDDDEEDEDEGGKTKEKGSKMRKKGAAGKGKVAGSKSKAKLGSTESKQKVKKGKGGSKDFQFDDNADGGQDTGTLMAGPSSAAAGKSGVEPSTNTDLRSAQ